MEPLNEAQKPKRFRIVKLEERVVPSHLPAVAAVQVASPAAEHAPTHAHKVDFTVRAMPTAGQECSNTCGFTCATR